ncbi:MAG: hypothetical protein QUU85_06045, partial [Candidatus Eisenbacteria bacterium]|nr:hypothetical protein [Candidatus Eisenbacteria bacterium]
MHRVVECGGRDGEEGPERERSDLPAQEGETILRRESDRSRADEDEQQIGAREHAHSERQAGEETRPARRRGRPEIEGDDRQEDPDRGGEQLRLVRRCLLYTSPS